MATVERFLEHFGNRLEEGDAGLFVGAGLSRPAGLVDWKEMLRDVADELGLNVEIENDLVAVAQYHVNTEGNRARLDRLIMEEFTRDAEPSPAHSIIARWPIRTIWTTNYDTLIEDALSQVGKRPDIKRVPENLAVSLPRRDAVVYKMHGDTSDPSRAVLTKEDYETYSATRQAFITTLQADLLTKTFLFLGFSFNDPNLDYVLARIRGLLGEHQREHYCLMKPPTEPNGGGEERAEWEYQKRKFDLRVADLRRYCIHTVLIEDYGEIPRILSQLQERARGRVLFISGSASFFDEYPRDRLEDLSRLLGQETVSSGHILVSGLGLGVGSAVLVGAMQWLYGAGNHTRRSTEECLSVRPFPIQIDDPRERQRIWTAHRRTMLGEAGFALFLAGNRAAPGSGDPEEAPGVVEEFELGVELNVVPIPIGASGSAARRLWKWVANDPERYYGKVDVQEELRIIGDPASEPTQIVSAAFEIIRKVKNR